MRAAASDYLQFIARGFARDRLFAFLMVATIGVGIASSLLVIALVRSLLADPVGDRTGNIYTVMLDPRPLSAGDAQVRNPGQLTYLDAVTLQAADRALRQAMMVGGVVEVSRASGDATGALSSARYTTRDFFEMFAVPFLDGNAWLEVDDQERQLVAVISRSLASRLFGTKPAVGETIRVGSLTFNVRGVIDTWRPTPRFYDLSSGPYARTEQIFIPFSTARMLKLQTQGSVDCWAATESPTEEGAPCTWLQFWIELPSEARASYEAFLHGYVADQVASGRFQRPNNNSLVSLPTYLKANVRLPDDVTIAAWVASGFYITCMANATCLLLVRFSRRTREVLIRRAIGATRRDVFQQLLVEAAAFGLLGAIFGQLLLTAGIRWLRTLPMQYSDLARIDVWLVVAGLIVCTLVTALAGLIPALRVSGIQPTLVARN